MRICVYIDGFNLYYGSLKKRPQCKWLDVEKLSHNILSSAGITRDKYNIEKIKYFIARVSGAYDFNAPARQRSYLSALRALDNLEIIYGRFLAKEIRRPLSNIPIADKPICIPQSDNITLPYGDHRVMNLDKEKLLPVREDFRTISSAKNNIHVKVSTMEEKGSDVNLACHLLNDSWKNLFDLALVMSNDSDLVESIKMVIRERNKQGIHSKSTRQGFQRFGKVCR